MHCEIDPEREARQPFRLLNNNIKNNNDTPLNQTQSSNSNTDKTNTNKPVNRLLQISIT